LNLPNLFLNLPSTYILAYKLGGLKEDSMRTTTDRINLSVNFNQVVDLVKQLPYKEKVKLGEVIRKETRLGISNDKIFTHFASEKTLAKDWLSPQEDEAWKNL
jgi:hypothetical protein